MWKTINFLVFFAKKSIFDTWKLILPQRKLYKQLFLFITKNYTMKKLVLSSIIMLGVCGIASAQTDSKLKQKHPEAATTSAAAPAFTPQKAAIMPATDVVGSTDAIVATDKEAAVAASVATPKGARVAKTEATTVNAAGVVVPAPTSDDAKRREAKMAAQKAANAAQTGKQQK